MRAPGTPDTRIDEGESGAVEDLAIFDADMVRIENMGSWYWMSIHAHGVAHEFSIRARKKNFPIVELEDSEPYVDGEVA